MAVDEERAIGLVFADNLVGDFGSPQLHVFDFGGLQIVIYRYAKCVGNGWMKRYLLGAIEHALDSVFLQPVGIHGDFPATYPDTGYDLIGIFIWLTFCLVCLFW